MRDLKLSFTDAYETETSWIVAETLCNACFELDKETGRVNYLFSFEGERPLQQGLYHQIYSCGRDLFFTPGYAKRICVWNMDTGERTYYPVTEKGDTGQRYVDSYRIGDAIWLLSSSLKQPIVRFDMKCRKAEYWEGYSDAVPEEAADKKRPVFLRQYAKKGKEVYAVVRDSPYLACFDLENRRVSVKKVGDYLLEDLCLDGAVFLFSMRGSGDILRWEADTGAMEIYPSETPGEERGYSNLIKIGGELLLVPNEGSRVMRVNPAGKRIEAFCDLPEGLGRMEDVRAGWRRFFSYRCEGDVVRLYPNQADCMVDVHMCERRISGRKFCLEESQYLDVFQKKILNAHFAEELLGERAEVAETRAADLDAYLVYVAQERQITLKSSESSYGETIHRALDCD